MTNQIGHMSGFPMPDSSANYQATKDLTRGQTFIPKFRSLTDICISNPVCRRA